MFVSIHHNATGAPTKKLRDLVHGTETYCFNARELLEQLTPEHIWFINAKPQAQPYRLLQQHLQRQVALSEGLAGSVHNSLVGSVRPKPFDRGTKTAHFRVLLLSTATIPAILVEVGYMSNEEEVKLLTDTSYRQQLSQAICAGIITFLNKTH